MKTKQITRFFDGGLVCNIDLTFHQIYYYIKERMPKAVRWTVDTGKTKRMYFWHYGNEYRPDSLCWTKLPN